MPNAARPGARPADRSPLERALADYAAFPPLLTDPRLPAWSTAGRPGDPRRALLATVVGQDLTTAGVARLLRDLDARLGDRLFEPWRLRSEELDAACRLAWLDAWPHRDLLSGWIASAGDVLREAPDPGSWSALWPAPRDFVRFLALRIPWMGRRSVDRVKGWRLTRWLVRGEGLDAPLWPAGIRAVLRLPAPILAYPLERFGTLPPGWDAWPPRRRQEWTDSVAAAAAPGDPASLWVPLETILRRGRADYRCIEHAGGCATCPLRPFCKPSAVR